MVDHYRGIRDTTGKIPLNIKALKDDTEYGDKIDMDVF